MLADNSWVKVLKAARVTVNKETSEKEPSSDWKLRILLSEHSPIRLLNFFYTWENLKYWVSVHLVRHKFGVEHFVSTQRTDRTGVDRNKKTQDEGVKHSINANAQAIINISRKRLCKQASKETREAWQEFLNNFKETEPELYSVCVPECVYRNGLCPEMQTCKYNFTKEFFAQRENYIEAIKNQISINQ